MTQEEIKKALNEALENACDNGFNMLEMTDMEIAEDVTRFDASLEEVDCEVLLPLIAEWRAGR